MNTIAKGAYSCAHQVVLNGGAGGIGLIIVEVLAEAELKGITAGIDVLRVRTG